MNRRVAPSTKSLCEETNHTRVKAARLDSAESVRTDARRQRLDLKLRFSIEFVKQISSVNSIEDDLWSIDGAVRWSRSMEPFDGAVRWSRPMEKPGQTG